MSYQLLDAFRDTFEGRKYRHRSSSQGDFVALRLYEDLHTLARSPKLVHRINTHLSILSTKNTRRGVKARRGDGSFGEAVPGGEIVVDPGFAVARGHIATIEIGIEVKILMKAMIKQIDRVTGD